jgi:hypothetical protein
VVSHRRVNTAPTHRSVENSVNMETTIIIKPIDFSIPYSIITIRFSSQLPTSMFRESDYEPPQLHESFYVSHNTPAFQRVAQNASFEGKHDEEINPLNLIVIPPTQNVMYDPTNPKADWSGMVSKEIIEKRHVKSDSNQRPGILVTDSGLTGGDLPNQDTNKPRKTFSVTSDPGLIGGINDVEMWKTENQRLFTQEPTHRDQLIMTRRTIPRRQLSNEHTAGTRVNLNHSQNLRIGNSRSVYGNIAPAIVDKL